MQSTLVSIRAKNESDQEKMLSVVNEVLQETRDVRLVGGTEDTILSATRELLLEIVIDRLIHEFNIPLDVGKPYRL